MSRFMSRIVVAPVTAAASITMPRVTPSRPAEWTREEREREERVRALRSERDRGRPPEELLEETLRVSRLISELQQGVARDVPAR
jgi:hypothetical protein